MKEALKLALEALELNNREWKATADSGDSGYWLAEEQAFYQQTEKAITAIKEALAQPEQRAQLLFDVDGEMLTASQIMGVELFNFQQATGCDTAAEFLAQPEQEPVACVVEHGATVKLEWASADAAHNAKVGNLYTNPPQRTWVGLTDLENAKFVKTMERGNFLVAIYDIEKKLKEKNT